MLYAAYGSNIDRKAMRIRCPHSRFMSIGYINDYKLEFRRYLNITYSEGDRVPVAIYELDEQDLPGLDAYEGYPRLYRREEIEVSANDNKMKANVYIMNTDNDINALYPPSVHYIVQVLDGYMDVDITKKTDIESLIRAYNEAAYM